jgi:hypothetical protein
MEGVVSEEGPVVLALETLRLTVQHRLWDIGKESRGGHRKRGMSGRVPCGVCVSPSGLWRESAF